MPKQFPHLLKPDRALWERFLESEHNTWDNFLYDIQCGDGRDPGSGFDQPYRQMGHQLSMRRIDAIGIKPDKHTIIEITCSAGLTQIGQLYSYPVWYQNCLDKPVQIDILLVAESLETDIEKVLIAHKLPYIVLEKGNPKS